MAVTMGVTVAVTVALTVTVCLTWSHACTVSGLAPCSSTKDHWNPSASVTYCVALARHQVWLSIVLHISSQSQEVGKDKDRDKRERETNTR